MGYGRFGIVFLAESINKGQKVAIKAIPTNIATIPELMQEAEILSELDHPNIVKYYKTYQSENYIYLTMEYCEGSQLFKKIVEKDKLTEEESIPIIEKLLKAINHCHKLRIIHRDLKPENIIYSSEGDIKLIDFGISTRLDAFTCDGFAGTIYYMAPEAVSSELYTKGFDVWSLGVIMHVLLTGCMPVGGQDKSEVIAKLKHYKGPNFKMEIWNNISSDAKDLLKKMLQPDYSKRISVADALNHPWLISKHNDPIIYRRDILEVLTKYSKLPIGKRDMQIRTLSPVSSCKL